MKLTDEERATHPVPPKDHLDDFPDPAMVEELLQCHLYPFLKPTTFLGRVRRLLYQLLPYLLCGVTGALLMAAWGYNQCA